MYQRFIFGKLIMNKIFKSIWNHTTRTFTAVSEATQTKGKKGRTVVTALLITTMMTVAGEAYSYDPNEDITSDSPLLIGLNAPYKIDTDTSGFQNNNTFKFTTSGTTLSTGTLFSLSSSAYEQVLFQTNNIDWRVYLGEFRDTNINDLRVRWTDGINDSDNGSVTQRQGDVGTLTFAVGDAAFDLISSNSDSFSNNDVSIYSGSIYIKDDVFGGKSYGENGLAYESADVNEDDLYNIWTLAILKQVDIDNEKTLVLSNINETDNIWAAKITGSGSIEYSGSGTVTIKSVLSNGFDDANEYTGTTNIKGASISQKLTINLEKEDSFGETSKLAATNTVINVNEANAWTSVQSLEYDSVDTTFANGIASFNVTSGDDYTENDNAVFYGANTIKTSSQEGFTYAVNGSMMVGSGSEYETTQFENSAGAMHLTVGETLTVNGNGALSVTSSDPSANNTISADVIKLLDYSSDIINTDQLKVGKSLNFVGGDGVYSINTDSFNAGSYAVNISDGADITYSSDDLLKNVSTTQISGGSSLTVTGVSSLGNAVVFDQAGEQYNRLFVKKSSDETTWTISGINFSSSDNTLLLFLKATETILLPSPKMTEVIGTAIKDGSAFQIRR